MKCVVLEDEQEYIVIDEIEKGETKYIYLANANNEKDICIRKEIKDEIIALDDEEEFTKAMLLFTENNKDKIKDLLHK